MRRISPTISGGSTIAPGRHGAFTLVELLVVIGVIAILAGLLLPALSRAKGKALGVACLGNLKQLSLAFDLYGADNGDAFPAGAARTSLGPQPEDWVWWQLYLDDTGEYAMRDGKRSAIAPYLSGFRTSYFRCPADRDALNRHTTWQEHPGRELYTFSYCLNAFSERGMATFISKDRSRVSINKRHGVMNPARKIMLAEVKGSAADGPGDAVIDDGRWLPLGYPLTVRHSGSGGAAFADGHVEFVARDFASAARPEHFDPQHP